MITILLLAFGLVLSSASEDLRLIAFNDTYSEWLPESEVQKLSECGQELNFMDITEYQNEYPPNPNVFLIPTFPTHQTVVEPLLADVSIDRIWQTITTLSGYPTRYYTSSSGQSSANWLISQYQSIASAHPEYTTAQRFAHTWLQPSVIGRIEGSVSPQEVVIIGGHIDSTSSGSTAPGADDDASGSSTVLEIFRVLTENGFRGERSIEFHGYAAEEVGLRGSQAIADNYRSNGVEVVAMLQLDMTGYVRAGTNPTIGVVTDFTNAQLNAFIRNLVTEYTTATFTNTQCGYACSDHASWNRAGYVDGFTFESTFSNSNPYIHTVSDTLNRLDRAHALQFAKLGLGFVVELSYQE